MKRILTLLAVAALALTTACTDRPAPAEPETTATVTETVTAEPTDALVSSEDVADLIARLLDAPTSTDVAVDNEAVVGLEEALTLSAEEHECQMVTDTVPKVAAYGAINVQEDNPETVTGLAAFGFATVTDAAAFVENLQTVLEECEAASYEVVPLTHHTDEAFEIRVESSDEQAASLVLLRNQHWVLANVSTPPADLALSLTLVDQLDEMLR